MNRSLRDITTAMASGDTDAFALFYRDWFDAMFAEARRVNGRDEQFCLDVVQESMLRVIRSVKPMDSTSDLHAWLRTVVQCSCLDALRRDRRRTRREVQVARRKGSQPADAGLDERLDWLRSELRNMDPAQVRLLTMRYRLGWTLQRIANAIGIKPGAVDGRISRSIAALRRHAMEDLHEP